MTELERVIAERIFKVLGSHSPLRSDLQRFVEYFIEERTTMQKIGIYIVAKFVDDFRDELKGLKEFH